MLNSGWLCIHDWRFAANNVQGILATHAEPVPKEAPNNMCSHRNVNRIGPSLKMVENSPPERTSAPARAQAICCL